MATVAKLSESEIQANLEKLEGWSIQSGKLHKTFRFGSFVEAFGFMTRAALVAETMQHHPEWSNVYDRVTVNLITHDAGGISDRDLALAKKMEELVGSAKSH